MIINKFITAFLVGCLFFSAPVMAKKYDIDAPKQKTIKIKPITKLVVDINPTRGVKFIFPWVLDEESKELPFDYTLIDSSVFNIDERESQNYVSINAVDVNAKEGAVTDLFINTAGYHFSVTLRINRSKKAHYSSIVFKLNDSDKLVLINNAIKKRTLALQREFKRKEKELDKKAERMALKYVGYLAQEDYDEESVKEEGELELDNGDVISIYVERIMRFGKFAVITLNIENDSKLESLYVQNMKLFIKDSTDVYRPSDAFYEIKPKVQKNESLNGFMVSTDLRIIADVEAKLVVQTDRGIVEVVW